MLASAPVVGALLGLVMALSVIAAAAASRGYRPGAPRWVSAAREIGPRMGRRAVLAIAAGVVVLVATRWVALSIALPGLILAWPSLFGVSRSFAEEIDTLEGVALWTEMIRDQIAVGPGLPEALLTTSANPPLALERPLGEFLGRLMYRQPIDEALRRIAADLNDPSADHTIAALILAANVQGGELKKILSALAVDTRRRVEDRRTATVENRRSGRNTKIIVITTVAVITGIAVFVPDWAAEYRTLTGQFVLAGAMALFMIGFIIIARLSRWQSPARFVLLREESASW